MEHIDLKKHNRKVFLGAFGMDAYWVKACTGQPFRFRYSDFNIGDTPITNNYVTEQKADWQETPKASLNHHIATATVSSPDYMNTTPHTNRHTRRS